MVLYVVGGVALAVGVWVLVGYNRFVEQRNLIRDSGSNVELQSELANAEDRIQAEPAVPEAVAPSTSF